MESVAIRAVVVSAILASCLSAQATSHMPREFLVAISLRHLRDSLQSQHTNRQGPSADLACIATPTALLIDETRNDVILVGQTSREIPPLTVQDLGLAFKNIDLMGDSATAPSIDIKPVSKGARTQRVTLGGRGVVDSKIGLLFFAQDLFLKLASFGYIDLGIGMPYEWELWRKLEKNGYTHSPHVDTASRMFYFPTTVHLVGDDRVQVLRTVTIEVLVDEWDEFHRELFEVGLPPQLVQALKNNAVKLATFRSASDFGDVEVLINRTLEQAGFANKRKWVIRTARTMHGRVHQSVEDESPDVAFAKEMSKHYAAIENRYPLLKMYDSIQGLLALTSSMRKSIPADLLTWYQALPTTKVPTPREIPVLFRSEPGLALLGFSGGIATLPPDIGGGSQSQAPHNEPELPGGVVDSLTTYFARAGYPEEMRRLVLHFRPTTDSVSWVVPLDASGIDRDTFVSSKLGKEVLARAKSAAPNWPSFVKSSFLGPFLDEAGNWKGWRQGQFPLTPHPTRGWEHLSRENNLLEFTGELEMGAGDNSVVRIDQLYIDPPSEVFGATYTVGIKTVLRNRFEFGTRAPIENRLMSFSPSSKLPGLLSFAAVGGLANVEAFANFQAIQPQANRPGVGLHFLTATPLRRRLYDSHGGGGARQSGWGAGSTEQRIPFGLGGWNVYAGPSFLCPIGPRFTATVRPLFNYASYSDERSGSSGSEGRIQERAMYLRVDPTVLVLKPWATTVGMGFGRVQGTRRNFPMNSDPSRFPTEKIRVNEIEFFITRSSKRRISRVSASVVQVPGGRLYYQWSMKLGLETLFMRKTKWF